MVKLSSCQVVKLSSEEDDKKKMKQDMQICRYADMQH